MRVKHRKQFYHYCINSMAVIKEWSSFYSSSSRGLVGQVMAQKEKQE